MSGASPLGRIGLTILAVGAGSGCTNAPGAVRFTITPEMAEYAPGDPVIVKTVLASGPSPICLAKDRFYELTVCKKGNPEAVARSGSVGYCGTGIVETMLFMPWLFAVAWLDVGDTLGRFTVLKTETELVEEVRLVNFGNHSCWARGIRQNSSEAAGDEGEPWPPGDYTVTFTLKNTHGHWLPPPVFWKCYDQPVATTVDVRIAPPAPVNTSDAEGASR